MAKLKVIELVMLAISAAVAAVKSVIKFIDYIVSARPKPAESI